MDKERAKEMYRLHHDETLTLAEVGREYGISRERVRQILRAAGYETRSRGEAAKLRAARTP
jgi:DNA-directed RNA polymerase sigma subunit (sigma70/sigma32)